MRISIFAALLIALLCIAGCQNHSTTTHPATASTCDSLSTQAEKLYDEYSVICYAAADSIAHANNWCRDTSEAGQRQSWAAQAAAEETPNAQAIWAEREKVLAQLQNCR